MPISLELPIGKDRENNLSDFIEDQNALQPLESASEQLLKREISTILLTLTPRERKVIQLRFGLCDDKARTLEEVGMECQLTRERVRQIESEALSKLRQRSVRLNDYLLS